jgi:1,4-alpha-glucan branching enzyme
MRIDSKRVRALMAVTGVALALSLTNCSNLNFIKRRLPPPTQTPQGVVFRFNAPSARVVQLAGNWPANNWLAGQAQTGTFLVGEMKNDKGDGIWTRTEPLPPGRYQYKFVVDRVNWKQDLNNPNRTDDGYGGFNSLMDVR